MTTIALHEDEGFSIKQFRLQVVSGPDAGTTYTSRDERTSVGTHGSNQFVLTDPAVSRFHFEIALVDGHPILVDLGSRNGIEIDRVPVLRAPLRTGALLSLGHTQLRFEFEERPLTMEASRSATFGQMVGNSASMRRVFALLEKAAASDATVLLEGETGTGKEAATEAIHQASARRDGPLIIVDCGAVPPELLESELFGHERGAFTGAAGARTGAFEAANQGTIFLDEIGELALDLQPKLLRALESREIKRIGQTRHVPIDVRVVAATNRDLRAEVNAKRFRSDLYYRIAVLEVRLPSLSERLDDLPLLVDGLLEAMGMAERPEAAPLRTPEFLQHLAGHAWPGNVRELRNHLERCIALRETSPLSGPAAAPTGEPLLDLTQPIRTAREQWTNRFERLYLQGMLAKHADNVSAVARAAGLDRAQIYRLLWKHGLR